MGATKDENLLRGYNANDLHYLGLPFDFCIYLKSITYQNLYYMFFHPIAESVSFLHLFILVNLRRVQNIIYFCTTLVG